MHYGDRFSGKSNVQQLTKRSELAPRKMLRINRTELLWQNRIRLLQTPFVVLNIRSAIWPRMKPFPGWLGRRSKILLFGRRRSSFSVCFDAITEAKEDQWIVLLFLCCVIIYRRYYMRRIVANFKIGWSWMNLEVAHCQKK